MKREDLLRQLAAADCVLVRHGGRHDIWLDPNTGQPVPRHHEIEDALAKHILKYLGLR